jgi:nitrogen-specific signal transduction histidine kinase
LFSVEIEKARQIIRVAISASKEQHRREVLNKHLLTTEAVQITVTTLSHYINNYLTALDGNLTLLDESARQIKLNDLYKEIIQKSQLNLESIKTVLRVFIEHNQLLVYPV